MTGPHHATTTTTTTTAISPDITSIPGTGWHGQAFLVGETVYLRLVEPEDSDDAIALRPSIFPWAPERAKRWIGEDLKPESQAVYVVRRKEDDEIVGSITVDRWGAIRNFDPQVRPLLDDRGDALLAEALKLLASYYVDECHSPMARISLRADRHILSDALTEAGARQVVRFREAYRVAGGYVDKVILEVANSRLLATSGDPLDEPIPRSGTGKPRPVIPPAMLDGDPPGNAVVIGPRVYLRPYQKGDGKIFSRYLRAETEPTWANGRILGSAHGLDRWMDDLQKADPLSWIRFTVCLRENDEPIGNLGIDTVDMVNGNGESESEINIVAYRGAGYGSEAKHLLFHYAFNILGLHSLQSYVIFPNTRSAAALRKQGYREAGRLHWWYPMNSLVAFDLLADDWRAMPRVEQPEPDFAHTHEGSAR